MCRSLVSDDSPAAFAERPRCSRQTRDGKLSAEPLGERLHASDVPLLGVLACQLLCRVEEGLRRALRCGCRHENRVVARPVAGIELESDPLGERLDDLVARANPRKERRDVVRLGKRTQRSPVPSPLPPAAGHVGMAALNDAMRCDRGSYGRGRRYATALWWTARTTTVAELSGPSIV